jgi:hypothetical protein
MQAWHEYRPFQAGEFVVCFADTAAGGNDNCAVQFLSHKWLDVPLVYHQNVTATYMTPLLHDRLTEISRSTGVQPIVAFERNNGGGFEMERLGRLNRNGDYRIYTMKQLNPYGQLADSGKLGWDTNVATRPKMLQELKMAVDQRLIHLYHRPTINEMFSFIVNKNGKAEAEQGAHDDLVMALAGAWQLYQTERPIDQSNSGGVIETEQNNQFAQQAGVLYAGTNNYDTYN